MNNLSALVNQLCGAAYSFDVNAMHHSDVLRLGIDTVSGSATINDPAMKMRSQSTLVYDAFCDQ
jgi:hypothetical protein